MKRVARRGLCMVRSKLFRREIGSVSLARLASAAREIWRHFLARSEQIHAIEHIAARFEGIHREVEAVMSRDRSRSSRDRSPSPASRNVLPDRN